MTLPTSQPQEYALILNEKHQLTGDVFELRFKKPGNFVYRAGQFIQVRVPEDGKQYLRAYSLSSTPADSYLECCVKILPEGKASHLFLQATLGDTIFCKGPFGRFVNASLDNTLQCIATGVGIAPIIAIITDELRTKQNTRRIQLLFGVRSEQDIFWLERLETLKRAYANFDYTLTLSKPSVTWQASRGRVTDHLPADGTADQYFICGSPDMVRDVRGSLAEKKVNPSQVHFEIF